MVAQDAEGLACYCKRPDSADRSVEANVLASFAGCYAENYFRRKLGYRERGHEEITWSLDWKEARGIEGRFSWDYLAGRGIKEVHESLETRAQELVAANWSVVKRLAADPLNREWEPKKALKSGARWSDADMAKYLLGHEIVAILGGIGINATSVQEC